MVLIRFNQNVTADCHFIYMFCTTNFNRINLMYRVRKILWQYIVTFWNNALISLRITCHYFILVDANFNFLFKSQMQYIHSFPYFFEICENYFQVVKSNQTVNVTVNIESNTTRQNYLWSCFWMLKYKHSSSRHFLHFYLLKSANNL